MAPPYLTQGTAEVGIKPCLSALVPLVHGNGQLCLQENILQISCSPAPRNVSSGDKAGRKHWAFLIQIFFRQVRQHNGECALEILQYFYTKDLFNLASNCKYFWNEWQDKEDWRRVPDLLPSPWILHASLPFATHLVRWRTGQGKQRIGKFQQKQTFCHTLWVITHSFVSRTFVQFHWTHSA